MLDFDDCPCGQQNCAGCPGGDYERYQRDQEKFDKEIKAEQKLRQGLPLITAESWKAKIDHAIKHNDDKIGKCALGMVDEVLKRAVVASNERETSVSVSFERSQNKAIAIASKILETEPYLFKVRADHNTITISI
jgi:hypothetical protein